MKPKHSIPRTPQAWLEEIARGYNDARETLPFAKLLVHKLEEKDCFHLAPLVCLKFRGLPKRFEKQATEAALSSYVATESRHPEALSKPYNAFAFAYLASHYGLDLITEDEVIQIMNFIMVEQDRFAEKIAKFRSKR